MRTRASIRNHPIHPMLIVFPIAFWVGSLICDLIYHFGSQNPFWKDVAFYSMLGGIVGAVAAAIPGLIDYTGLPVGRLKRIGFVHMVLNLAVVAAYLFNLGLRYAGRGDSIFPVFLSLVSLLILSGSGWLGASLVHEHGVGVRDDVDMDRRHDRAA